MNLTWTGSRNESMSDRMVVIKWALLETFFAWSS
jgi:hypothetical protein